MMSRSCPGTRVAPRSHVGAIFQPISESAGKIGRAHVSAGQGHEGGTRRSGTALVRPVGTTGFEPATLDPQNGAVGVPARQTRCTSFSSSQYAAKVRPRVRRVVPQLIPIPSRSQCARHHRRRRASVHEDVGRSGAGEDPPPGGAGAEPAVGVRHGRPTCQVGEFMTERPSPALSSSMPGWSRRASRSQGRAASFMVSRVVGRRAVDRLARTAVVRERI